MSLLGRIAERRVRDIQPTPGRCSGALSERCRGDVAQPIALPSGERRFACGICIEAAAAMGLHLTPAVPAWRANLSARDETGAVRAA